MYPTVPHGCCEHPERPSAAPGAVGHTGTVRVLVVEDERRLASAVRRGLTAGLRALRRGGAGPRPAVLVAGDLRLDPAARTVRRGEAGIELTAREFALLEYLMRRAGQVVSKAELIEHVWDSDAVADLNVVEVYAGYVRRKIDAPFGRNALQTVRGAGYRLAADGG